MMLFSTYDLQNQMLFSYSKCKIEVLYLVLVMLMLNHKYTLVNGIWIILSRLLSASGAA